MRCRVIETRIFMKRCALRYAYACFKLNAAYVFAQVSSLSSLTLVNLEAKRKIPNRSSWLALPGKPHRETEMCRNAPSRNWNSRRMSRKIWGCRLRGQKIIKGTARSIVSRLRFYLPPLFYFPRQEVPDRVLNLRIFGFDVFLTKVTR